MCGKLYDGFCSSRGLGCYKCGKIGHVSRDFPQGAIPLCFHCVQVGYKKADYLMIRGGVMSALAATILRITDGWEVRAGALAERGHISQY